MITKYFKDFHFLRHEKNSLLGFGPAGEDPGFSSEGVHH